MRELERTVSGEFALDASKLQRVVSIIQSAFSGKAYDLTLVATLKNQKRITTHDLQDLIAIDNTIANPVNRLEIQAICASESKSCNVVFRPENDEFHSGVPISVKSDDAPWASNLFSELEEQVERAILRDQVSKYRQSKLFRRLTPLVILLVISIGFLVTMLRSITNLAPNDSELASITRLAEVAQSSEQKLDFLVAYSRHQLQKTRSFATSGFPFSFEALNLHFFIGASPFLLVAGLIIFALTTCYPGSAFLWGDYADHYSTLLKRRSQVWNVVVIALLVGLLINLSSAVISRGIGI